MTFEGITYEQFKQSAGEYFRAVVDPAMTAEQIENGFKALTLLYFGQDDDWTEYEINSACLVIRIAGRKSIEKQMAEVLNG